MLLIVSRPSQRCMSLHMNVHQGPRTGAYESLCASARQQSMDHRATVRNFCERVAQAIVTA